MPITILCQASLFYKKPQMPSTTSILKNILSFKTLPIHICKKTMRVTMYCQTENYNITWHSGRINVHKTRLPALKVLVTYQTFPIGMIVICNKYN